MQTCHTGSKIQYNLKIIKLYSSNEQVFTFWLHHHSKFSLILLVYADIFW